MSNLIGIFENKLNGDYFWYNYFNEHNINDAKYYAKYFVDEANDAGCHANVKSALYDNMTDYIDELQDEHDLSYGELYVVTYFEFEECSWSLIQKVDFGITKEQIIENVKAQKYVEGANYFTMGQMFYTTKMVLDGEYQ